MATNFPTSLDTLINPNAGDSVAIVSHADQHANANDAIEALQAKVGVNSSAVTTTHDYKLSEVTTTDKAVGKTAAQTLTNKTLTSPVLNTPDINGGTIDDADITNPTLNGTVQLDLGSDATGDIYYRNSSGDLVRLPIGSNTEVLTVVAGLPNWEAVTSGGGAKVRAYKSTTQSLTSATLTKITFDTEEFDTGSNFASSTFTAPETGYYVVDTKVITNNIREVEFHIYKNGASYSRNKVMTQSGSPPGSTINELMLLAINDTIEVYGNNTQGTSSVDLLAGSDDTKLTIYKV